MLKISMLFIIVFTLHSLTVCGQTENRHVILWSGTGKGDTTELYTITELRRVSLPHYDPANDPLPVSLERVIQIAKKHIYEKYKVNEVVLESIKLQKFGTQTDKLIDVSDQNWVFLVSFYYDSRGYVQIIPVLLDESIVLGSNE